MENGLIQLAFQIPTKVSTYPAKYVAPIWAQGFECYASDCGLCCLTEKPNNVSGIHNAQLDKAICQLFNTRTKICRRYVDRPDLCKLYPLFFGVEDGQVIIMTSLECPGTCSDKLPRVELISELMKEPYLAGRLAFFDNCYEQAILHSDLLDTKCFQTRLVPEIRNMFRERRHFPFLLEAVQLIYKVLGESFGKKVSTIPPFSVPAVIRSTEGLYIATRFQSYDLGLIRTKGSKLKIISFDEELREKKNIKKAMPTAFKELELDKGAQQLLYEYILLIMERPYLSLSAVLAVLNQEPVSLNFARGIAGVFAPIEAGATLIAERDNITRIDRDTMREIISFSEGNSRGSFIRPDKLHEY
jgi:Fe-S-cluster containining protein